MPLQATSGAASYDAFGGGVPVEPVYIEQIFSTWLYTGNGTSQSINNGIDLAGKGGMVWTKSRTTTAWHEQTDTVRGASKYLSSNSNFAQQNSQPNHVTAFNTNGFSVGNETDVNANGVPYVSWTWAEAPKFFDVVTYTGNGSTFRTIAHNLGSVPGCMLVKRTDVASDWQVYHRSIANTTYLVLNDTAAVAGFNNTRWASTTPNSTSFFVGNSTTVNANGGTYVAYLFAHNAGGFGLTGTDNVISCGSYVGDSASAGKFIELGYEPQWVLQKASSASGTDWHIQDVMRGAPVNNPNGKVLRPNSSVAEYDGTNAYPAATGFYAAGDDNNSGTTYIYIAIRRGPMRVPTTGTSVYSGTTWTGNGTTGRTLSTGLSSPPDLSITQWRNGTQINLLWDKLRGFSTTPSTNSAFLRTPSTNPESALPNYLYIPDMVNFGFGSTASSGSQQLNSSGETLVGWNFRRAPGFFDEVCYTGTGAAMTVAHNLGVAPELIILKSRNNAESWMVYAAPLGNAQWLSLNSSFESDSAGLRWNDTTPTASVFSVGKFSGTTPWSSGSGYTYVAYLFASAPGVSKVGSFTGTGATQVINCGFTGGARFVLIKATSTAGDWYVWDSARGIVSGNDPYLELNTGDAEVTNTDWVDTAATGFELSNAGGNLANSSGVSYVFLAVA